MSLSSTLSAHALLELLQQRAHVAPKRLVAPGPTPEALSLLFEAAATAPDHGRIHPWRFVLVPLEARPRLGQAFVEALQARDPQATPEQRTSAFDKALRSPCLMLAILRNHPPEMALPNTPAIPYDERLVSLGCAIQNMLLMAQALGYGSGITSGKALHADALRALFELQTHETAICFLNFGTVSQTKPPRQRPAIAQFVRSL